MNEKSIISWTLITLKLKRSNRNSEKGKQGALEKNIHAAIVDCPYFQIKKIVSFKRHICGL